MKRQIKTGCTFLRALARDKRANVMAMAAVALIPMLAMIGGAIDASRLYMAQTRLQQACDAGALAGRKAMSNVNTLSSSEAQTAEKFFDFNFPDRTYDASQIERHYTRGATAGTVNGTASLVMPTTIMRLFGYTTVPLHVSCGSTLIIPNTDVMFVLDVTGSMAETPSGDSQSKIDGLKAAAKAFYASLGPGAASGPGRIRYGFMPYSSNVNVGLIVKALGLGYIAGENGTEMWHYRSRLPVTVVDHYISAYGTESADTGQTTSKTNVSTGSWQLKSPLQYYDNGSSTSCTKAAPASTDESTGNATRSNTYEESPAYPDNLKDRKYQTTQPRKTTDFRWTYYRYNNANYCAVEYRETTYTAVTNSSTTQPITWSDRQKFDHWAFGDVTTDVSPIVRNGSMTNTAYYTGYYSGTSPNYNYGIDGRYSNTATSITWAGCIEEASTVSTIDGSSSLSVPSGANDLDIDLKPGTGSTEKKWKPFLRLMQYQPGGTYGYWMAPTPGYTSDASACPTQASKLQQYASDYDANTKSSAAFNSYVNALAPGGLTSHDIGMIWGARFLSPTGIFAAENADSAAPSGAQVSRNIVFMTDGTMQVSSVNNDPYGMNNLEGRITSTGANDSKMIEVHTRRLQIICNEMKSKGFIVWVIGFGISSMPDTLQKCASDDNHWSLSSNSAQLKTRFEAIAQTIGGLRLSS